MFTSIALLIARILVGWIFIAHGAQKLFGWFGGYGLKGTGGFFESLGMRPGPLFALAAGLGEFVGGALVLLGWLNPIGPALIVAVMLVAIATVHISKGFWSSNGGYEYNLANIAAALAIAGAGEGWYSIDAVAPIAALSQPNVAAIVFAVIVLGGLLSLAVRRAPKTANA
ncbi:MAG: DoxX family protein [Candidatus Eremiobacteraeota bacterium]|nr:DoxX family protein [Candidatus Eremiobacteraeota bacterium]MBV8366819.1 DoxX family protein [Candidatus Eremiobacteraeota bacterium]